jgi:hypothetical protein
MLGEVPERPKGADCKSAGVCLRRFESSPPHWVYGAESRGFDLTLPADWCGNSSVGRASAFQAEGRGFESRFPLQLSLFEPEAHVAQTAEHFLGKEEVTGSIPVVSFIFSLRCAVALSSP